MDTLFREKFYAGVAADPDLHVKLTGSWETIVGELDTFGGPHSLYFSELRAQVSSLSSHS